MLIKGCSIGSIHGSGFGILGLMNRGSSKGSIKGLGFPWRKGTLV